MCCQLLFLSTRSPHGTLLTAAAPLHLPRTQFISRAFHRPATCQSTGALGVPGCCVVFLGGSGGKCGALLEKCAQHELKFNLAKIICLVVLQNCIIVNGSANQSDPMRSKPNHSTPFSRSNERAAAPFCGTNTSAYWKIIALSPECDACHRSASGFC